MKKIVVIILALVLIFSLCYAEQKKSIKKAILLSALLPGLGEYYAKNTSNAIIMGSAETLIWLSYYKIGKEIDLAEKDYIKFAHYYADISANDFSEEYLQDIQDFYSSDKYNSELKNYARYLYDGNITGDDYNNYVKKNGYYNQYSWEWDTVDHWNSYQDLRQRKKELEILSKFTIGAVIINRVVSIIDAARSVSKYNKQISEKNNVSINFKMDVFKQNIKLEFCKKF
ncbi:MAG: hypothetical protein DRH57_02485 [Candidatus Cloacimonadota bacterium]|nr:MAG: hypothetical protein DRH57_02485 [Candidatus Cloacimonadota bacterium]